MRCRQRLAAMTSSLSIARFGQGSPVVLLHGWGMHGGVFQPLAEQLARHNTVLAVDLPGHGESASYAQFSDLPEHATYIVEQLSDLFQEGVVLLGWSMGGLLAQAIAMQYPQYVTHLILICSTPCFQRRADWTYAVDRKVLTAFADDLQRDYQATLSRFLALQFIGDQQRQENLRKARALLFARPRPQVAMLQQGLRLLETVDTRAQLGRIRCPTLVLNGEHDTLVPTLAGQYLAEHVHAGRCVIFKGAGHAPFLSHSDKLTHFIHGFIHAD